MSHQRYLSHDPIKEPHSVSVKVLRLSCPSLVPQYPIEPPFKPSTTTTTAIAAAADASPLPASLAYQPSSTNPSPFLLSPILNLPVSFGSAYVGETFSCTLCANNDLDDSSSTATTKRQIRDVRVEAEMKTPGQTKAQSLELGPAPSSQESAAVGAAAAAATDLAPGGTLQKIVSFDLKEEGNHVLAVTVSYYEAAETSGRTRTFRKLYQFICKPSLIVRTKVGVLVAPAPKKKKKQQQQQPLRRWVLEAQLENCSDDTMQLDRVVMELEPGLTCRDCNWTAGAGTGPGSGSAGLQKPVLQPGEVEQVCFVIETRRGGNEEEEEDVDVVARARARAAGGPDARVVFGVLGIGWRGEMGNRGFLSTGKLGTRVVR
ncbi:Trafficking protein particle complex subunit 13 [Beauveria bassiana]|nr:Trafficking protein particle complex subunit 13 [Beauveria bassiana]KAH8720740.1 Trafficking protein particle complex subunit 13 [Beauveria bassiana]